MFGLNLHLPPFVVVAVTVGGESGYAFGNLTANSKKPNSYGVSAGPMMRAFTSRTSFSLQATAIAESVSQTINTLVMVNETYTDRDSSGSH